jgi:Mrp family chromosome partitioning ATPase
MQKFLREVCDQYDRVFLDCPPISAVSDPLVIAAMSDGVVFVTKFNKIRRENARKSVQRIQDAGIKIHGIVLNDIDFEGKDSYYYSYYYYQNRYYNSHYKNSDQGGKPKRAESTVDQA